MSEDIRWIQRFDNYKRALKLLRDAVELASKRELSILEQQGMIQAFEMTHELSWKTQKDLLQYRGVQDIYGSKDVARHAFKVGLVENGKTWMEMIQSRNMTSHTYDEETVKEIIELIISDYMKAFSDLETKLVVEMSKDSE